MLFKESKIIVIITFVLKTSIVHFSCLGFCKAEPTGVSMWFSGHIHLMFQKVLGLSRL